MKKAEKAKKKRKKGSRRAHLDDGGVDNGTRRRRRRRRRRHRPSRRRGPATALYHDAGPGPDEDRDESGSMLPPVLVLLPTLALVVVGVVVAGRSHGQRWLGRGGVVGRRRRRHRRHRRRPPRPRGVAPHR